MALGLPGTSTSTSPTSTSNPNSFQPGTSPPLVLAFIAIGVFGMGVVLLFGYRRLHTPRFQPHAMMLKQEPPAGPKPELWDVQINTLPSKDGWMPVNSWGDIMPLSAMAPSPLIPLKAEPPPPNLPGRRTNPFTNLFTHRPRFPTSLSRMPASFTTATPLPAEAAASTIQIAILISMPVPPNSNEVMEIPECHIGLTEVPSGDFR